VPAGILAIALCLVSTFAFAQAAGPAGPAPNVAIASSPVERVVVVRLKNGMDLLAGLKEAVTRERIRNGVILSAFGSVTSYHVHVVDNTTFPPKDVYKKGDGPYDLLNVSGMVLGGRVHPHITLASPSQVVGGHLEDGTRVFTFATISIGVLSEAIDLSRHDDWNWH
jgi:predicted DNA-binding protein with PD1-like motif